MNNFYVPNPSPAYKKLVANVEENKISHVVCKISSHLAPYDCNHMVIKGCEVEVIIGKKFWNDWQAVSKSLKEIGGVISVKPLP